VDNNFQTLLIVEDDEDLRNGLVFTFQQEGYRVCGASSIGKARKILKEEPVDLMILDVMLPDGSGFDFCRGLRESGEPENELRYRNLPVLFLSARDDEIDVVQGLELGGDDYITKPFRLRELVSRVRVRLKRQSSAG